MKKFYFLAALVAGTALTSCTSEDDLALSPPEVNVEDGYAPIVFSSLKNNITRGDITGKDAADSLGGKFVVFGYKGDATASPGNTVFDNYLVKYIENSADKTESNSSNWEYVLENDATVPVPIKHAIDNGITKQTIKYWDFSKPQYDFIAWSTGKKRAIFEGNPTTGEVLVSEITPQAVDANDPTKGLGAAYTFTGTAKDLRECYIADLVTVKKGTAGEYGEVSGYGQPVTLRFRQLGTKVRIALYETIPGYSVKNVRFYTAAVSTDVNDMGQETPTLFTTTENEIFTEGTYTVSFPTVDKPDSIDNNQAHITFQPIQVGGSDKPQETTVAWGNLNYTIRESGEKSEDAIYLGRTSNTASFAGIADENYYQVFLPNQNGTNLNLRVNYTLEAIDGCGEIIEVKGATAQVPLIYAQWKAGYAYTYLFKISDKTNGHTGIYDPTQPDDATVNSDPAGLFPITFDAVVINAEDGDKTQETITLVATPSITTYQNGSKVVNNNEYTVLTTSADKPEITGEIYVTVNDGVNTYQEVTVTAGNSVAGYYTSADEVTYTPCGANDVAVDGTKYYKQMLPKLEDGTLQLLTDKVNLYKVPAGTTEAQVIDALQCQDEDKGEYTFKGRNGIGLTEAKDATDNTKNLLVLTDSVKYGVDGNAIGVGTDKAAKFVPEANTTYAFIYTKTAATGDDKVLYQAVKFEDATVTTKYRYDYKNATPSFTDGNNDANNVYDAQKGVNYYTKAGDAYTKVAKPFIGQGVSNLYLDDQGNTIATGYAVTGTDYYYTTDGGQHYTKAENIAYASFASATDLYTRSGSGTTADPYVWTQKPTSVTSPEDGTAYYQRTGTEGNYVYTYCVILPEQTDTWYEIDTTKYVQATENAAVAGQTYFDKYTKNNAERYAKVIKVQ